MWEKRARNGGTKKAQTVAGKEKNETEESGIMRGGRKRERETVERMMFIIVRNNYL